MKKAENRIAVIGAGIVGVSCAIWLQRDGHDVVLIDREGPAAGTSHGNAGVLASIAVVPVNSPGMATSAPKMIFDPNSPLFLRWTYLPKMLPWLMRYLGRVNSTDATATATALTQILFDSYEQHYALAKDTGAEKWLKASDYLFIYDDRKSFNKDKFAWNLRKKMGFSWDEMESAQFDEYDPIFKGGNKFVIRLKNHGFITDPGKYVKALAEHFKHQGGEIIVANVLDVEHHRDKVSAVKTSTGEIKCTHMVLAAGIWSTDLAKKLGINPSMETERGYHIELINPSVMPKCPMMLTSGKFVATPMEGRLRCAGIVEFGGLKAPPSKAPFELLKRQIHAAIPDLTYDHVEEWMGHRPTPSDSIPLIGPVNNITGAYAAFGHQHIGLTGGPKSGRMIADMIAGRKSNINLAPYEVSRFTH
ncbi:MAG: FAD-binding oxidoreductase [Rhizobiaceae bacterium]|nr:FAD-binding oxidoreductase [Rhizobiaceae bacterium]